MSDLNISLSYRDSSSYTHDSSGNDTDFSTGTGADTLQSRAREKYGDLLQGSEDRAEGTPADDASEQIESIAYRATSNYFARAFDLPKGTEGQVSFDKGSVLRRFDWKNERVADMTVDSIFEDVIGQVAAERSSRLQVRSGNVKAHPQLKPSKFSADKSAYDSRLDQMVQGIGGSALLKALREASDLIVSNMDDEEDEDSESDSANVSMKTPSMSTSSRPTRSSALSRRSASSRTSASSRADASSRAGASSASSEEAKAGQEKVSEALSSGGDDLVSLSENDELMKHASEEQKSELITKLQEHSDKKGKCDSRPEGNKAERAIANVMQSAKDKSEFDNLMKEHGGKALLDSVEYGEAKQSLVQAAAAWGSNEFIDDKHAEKYSKEISASQDLFLKPPSQASKLFAPGVGRYASDPTATGMERVQGESNAYIADQAYTNLSTRAQREIILMNAQREVADKDAVDYTEVISEVEKLRTETLAQIDPGNDASYKMQWGHWKDGLEEIRKNHDMDEDAFRHTVTSRYENFYLGTNVSFGEPDSGDKDERSAEEKYHSYTRDASDLEQLREKYGQKPTSAVAGLDASSSLGASSVAGQAAQEELHKLLQKYEHAVTTDGFDSSAAETLRQEIADLEENSSAYVEDLNQIGVEMDTLYQAPPADTFWLKFTEVFLAVAELAMTLAAAAFLGPAGVALVSAGWAIYHATQKDWLAMAGSLAGGAVGGMGTASSAIAKSAAKGSQTGATLARSIGQSVATSTTKASATTVAAAGSKSAFAQNVSNMVAKTGHVGKFMGLNPADDVLITTGKLTNITQTTFETSYAASQDDALGAVSSGLGLSQEGMAASRLTRLTQNTATVGVSTAYTVQAGQNFTDGNYEGTFDAISGFSNMGNMSGSNQYFKAGIGGVNEGLPTIDYSRSENLDTSAAADPKKKSLLSGSEDDTDAVDTTEETQRTEEAEEAEEVERARVAEEVEQKRFTGRSSQVQVEQMLEDTLGADVAKDIDAYYDPTMPEGQVRYTPDPDAEGKLQLSYGPKSNEQNIQWHVEHLDTLLQYNDNQGVGVLLPALSTPEAITLLEFDKHEKLIEKAQGVIADDTGQYTAADKAMAEENLAFYEQEQAEIMERISSEEHSHQLDAEGRRYVAGASTSHGAEKEIDNESAMVADVGGVQICERIRNGESNMKITDEARPDDLTDVEYNKMKTSFLDLLEQVAQTELGKKLLYKIESYRGKHGLEIMLFPGNYGWAVNIEALWGALVKIHKRNPMLDISAEVEDDFYDSSIEAQEAMRKRSTLGEGASAVLVLNPCMPILPSREGEFIPADVALFHELIHVLHYLQGSVNEKKYQKTNLEEYSTVGAGPYLDEFTENNYRVDQELPLRERYAGYFFNSKKSEEVVAKKVEELYKNDPNLDEAILKRVQFKYAPKLVDNSVEYSFPSKESDAIVFSYGRSSNWMNLEFHARHLDVLGKYNDQQLKRRSKEGEPVEDIDAAKTIPPIYDDYRAQFQLEYDLYSKLNDYAEAVIRDPENSLDAFVAETNQAMYQERLRQLNKMLSGDIGYQFDHERVIGRAITSTDEVMIKKGRARDTSLNDGESVPRREITMDAEAFYAQDAGGISVDPKERKRIQRLVRTDVLNEFDRHENIEERKKLVQNLTPKQLWRVFDYIHANIDSAEGKALAQSLIDSASEKQKVEIVYNADSLSEGNNLLHYFDVSSVVKLFSGNRDLSFRSRLTTNLSSEQLVGLFRSENVGAHSKLNFIHALASTQLSDFLRNLDVEGWLKNTVIEQLDKDQIIEFLTDPSVINELKLNVINNSTPTQLSQLLMAANLSNSQTVEIVQALTPTQLVNFLLSPNVAEGPKLNVIRALTPTQLSEILLYNGAIEHSKGPIVSHLTDQQVSDFLLSQNVGEEAKGKLIQEISAEHLGKLLLSDEVEPKGLIVGHLTDQQVSDFLLSQNVGEDAKDKLSQEMSTERLNNLLSSDEVDIQGKGAVMNASKPEDLEDFFSDPSIDNELQIRMVKQLSDEQILCILEPGCISSEEAKKLILGALSMTQLNRVLGTDDLRVGDRLKIANYLNIEQKIFALSSLNLRDATRDLLTSSIDANDIRGLLAVPGILRSRKKNIVAELTKEQQINVLRSNDINEKVKAEFRELLEEVGLIHSDPNTLS